MIKKLDKNSDKWALIDKICAYYDTNEKTIIILKITDNCEYKFVGLKVNDYNHETNDFNFDIKSSVVRYTAKGFEIYSFDTEKEFFEWGLTKL